MVAFVPIRSGSKGIPDKNVRDFNGKPLVWWVLNALEHSDVDEMVVSTDSERYMDIVASFGFGKLGFHKRSDDTASDVASTESVMLEYLKDTSETDFMLVQATSPLVKSEHINGAIKLYGEYDSVLSVVRQKRFIWKTDGTPLNYDYKNRPRRQDFDGFLVENGAIYINSVANILRDKNRLSGNIGLYEMPEYTYFEIDSEEDWEIMSGLAAHV